MQLHVLSDVVADRDILRDLLPDGFDDLAARLELHSLDSGDVLIQQGDPGDSMYVLLRGRLAVRIENGDGSATKVDEVGPGGVVGELALLTGQPRTATVVALERSDLVRLSREAFEAIAVADADGMHAFMRRVLDRSRRSQVGQLLTELFGTLDEGTMRELESRLSWLHLASGAQLFAQGDAGEDAFLVVNGRLRVATRDDSGCDVVVDEVGRGAAVGEEALLTGAARGVSVHAIRDTHLLRLTRATFDAMLDRHPRAMMQIARAAVTRLNGALAHRAPARPATIALIAAGPDVPLDALAGRLCGVLQAFGSTLRLDAGEVDRMLANPDVAHSAEGSVLHEALTAWLSRAERDHSMVILQGDLNWSAWTRRCAQQADRILVVGRAGSAPQLTEAEIAIAELDLRGRMELVLLHSDATVRPSGTSQWLQGRNVAAHHHVRLGNDADVQRLARRITGRANGLVLGGGGARGFVHVGALQALAEAGVTIDVYGGTSIGALIAAAASMGVSVKDMHSLARDFASPRKLLDRTLPIAALMTGAKVTAFYRELFGDTSIEDMWLPYFGISSGLSRAKAIVHDRGTLWQAVRASTAIPAIFPPFLGDDDEVHVDGGVMNNMPLDVMRQLCEAGTVIGVNPMPTHDRLRSYNFGPSISGWAALAGRFKLFGSRLRAPSILGSVMRATEINSANRMRQTGFRAIADLLIEPAVGDFPILAFGRYADIVEIGYRAAQEAITAWQAASRIETSSSQMARTTVKVA